jgi:ADP-ribose pyrophosphatase
MDFLGAKLALFLGDQLLVIRRDDRADIPFPNHLDLPGGGREGAETPEACVLRETREEVGLILTKDALVWGRSYVRPRGTAWFFAAHLEAESAGICAWRRGAVWSLMPPAPSRHPERCRIPRSRETT